MDKTFKERFKSLRRERGLTQEEMGGILKVSKQAVSNYENGKRQPELETLEVIAEYFNVDMNYLIGRSEIKNSHENLMKLQKEMESNIDFLDLPSDTVKIPVLGRIPAGVPVEAMGDVLGYEEIPLDWKRGGREYIALVVKGDSMYPKYFEGDTVIIQLQKDCNSGQDCAVYVNDSYEATLKTVKKGENSITLTPINTAYPPKTYTYPSEVQILGVVKELRRKI
ncbi:MAG: helix-turn-helix domain-containing protein [Tissierellia bacterium]|nr:helix-turn-helix domain-containing protein [Tissierellia bacterium]